jgi:CRP/FNR family transcriptional regulator, cyclic AMP receptor protein
MSTTKTLEPILSELPVFKGMKPDHLALMAGCASNVRFDAGEFVGRQGEPADRFWIVRQGSVAIEIHAPGRGTVTIATIGANEVLGWSWLLPPHQWHFDARALSTTRALALDGRCLRGKFSTDHELGYEVMCRFAPLIAQRLEATSIQLLDVYGTHV